MPNSLGPTGLITQTQPELLAQFTAGYQLAYGNSSINFDSDTSDGQAINITIQAILDILDLMTQVYNSFDPDNAVGVVLDQRVAINGIQRQAGTFTVTNITVVTNQSVNLFGIDQTDQTPFSVADNSGNIYALQITQLAVPVGTNVFSFQCETEGAISPLPNTIVIQNTIVLGVQSVNNPTTFTTLGINEESDANLRLRRQKSVSIASQGYYRGLLAALLNLSGITSAQVYENDGDTVDGNGIPGHSIWVIVGGSATPESIATLIYNYRNAGCGMFGAQSYTVTQANGTSFIIHYDNVSTEDLFIQFNATSLNGTAAPNTPAILSYLVSNYNPTVGEEVNINQLATLVQIADPNTLVTGAGFSTTSGGTYTNTLQPSALNKQFVLSPDNISITIV